ncbi:GreA/GreB family elongation factor [Kibdelosporangium persicum]|nr:GreA/GreB family elongation factor [Kibdelosporangium persicum]
MTSTSSRHWLSQHAHAALRDELARLLRHQHTTGNADPDVTTADRDDHDTIVRTGQRQARIREIQDLLRDAVVGEDPPDDGIAEPGMVLTVRYDDDNDTETFLLGLRHEAELGDIEVYSPDSPIGIALYGARRGEQRTYTVPNGDTVRVTLLDAAPYGHHQSTVRR